MSSKAEKLTTERLTAGKLPTDRMPEANKLFVGEGVTVREAVLSADTVTVDGVLEGDIATVNLVVNATGTIRGRISVAKNAEIFGTVLERFDVKGDLIMRSGGSVAGTVSYGRLSLEQGASITGEISSPDHRAAQQPPVPDHKPEIRSGNGFMPLDLSALELMPGPIAATS